MTVISDNMSSSKYRVIIKVDTDKFIRYHSSNLLSLTKHLDKNYKAWRWFNVYDYTTGQQLANYTINSKPTTKLV